MNRTIEESVKLRVIEYCSEQTELRGVQVVPNDFNGEFKTPCLVIACTRNEERVPGSGLWNLTLSADAMVNAILDQSPGAKVALDNVFAAVESVLLSNGIESRLSTPLLRVFSILADSTEEGQQDQRRNRALNMTVFAAQMGGALQRR